ncbi:DEAD/DEAH box helicase [Shewanella colwelliana]|uniref:RNA helicase n=1 Tax=Shewanella colwelliana TaxID=23 RepID=A0ABQ4NZ95_SHECO|nr:DEAD/DEAH box helicase [Shewanella colwelliana]MDX1281965.1 DEAD/DEAH box helicase [Shewanella colwelliana]GIU40386.1 RNA helicase [Shewanella colwelliana]
MTFDSLSLHPQLLTAAQHCGYTQLTQVQSKVIPVAIEGRDIMVCAETGTGKTAAYTFPMLHRLMNTSRNVGQLNVLVLTPTRELAIQVGESISRYSRETGLSSVAVYGGANINPQRKAINQGVDILVATPGRLFDLIGQHGLELADVNQLIVDEADRMLDLGFVKDIERVKTLVAAHHSTQLFSATFSSGIKALATKMLQTPEWINVAQSTTADLVRQEVYSVDKRRKAELLAELIGRNNWQQVLVFVSTKESAEALHKELKLDGINNAVFHGDKTQGARNRALEQFKAGELRVMVATDVAARGLDIAALPLVVNLELPFAAEDYVHRIGRTGRAGNTGHAISFVALNDEKMLKEIEGLIGEVLPRHIEPGYELGAPLPARYRELQVDSSAKPKVQYKRKKSSGKKPTNSYASRRANKSSR